MNIGTKIRTVLAIATSLNTALLATDITGFNNPTLDLIYKIASVALNFVIVACVTWFNNDYSPEACEATGELRQRKAEKDEDYQGDIFYGDEG
jgi:hypothetical protein